LVKWVALIVLVYKRITINDNINIIVFKLDLFIAFKFYLN